VRVESVVKLVHGRDNGRDARVVLGEEKGGPFILLRSCQSDISI
jgi:hypothetical protein